MATDTQAGRPPGRQTGAEGEAFDAAGDDDTPLTAAQLEEWGYGTRYLGPTRRRDRLDGTEIPGHPPRDVLDRIAADPRYHPPPSLAHEPVRFFRSFSDRVFRCIPNAITDAPTQSKLRRDWPFERLSRMSRDSLHTTPPSASSAASTQDSAETAKTLVFERFVNTLYTAKSASESERDDYAMLEREVSYLKSESVHSIFMRDCVPCVVHVPIVWVAINERGVRGMRPLALRSYATDPRARAPASGPGAPRPVTPSDGSAPLPAFDMHQLYVMLPRIWLADAPLFPGLSAPHPTQQCRDFIPRVLRRTPQQSAAAAAAAAASEMEMRRGGGWLDLSGGSDMRYVDHWIVSMLRELSAMNRLLHPWMSLAPPLPTAVAAAAVGAEAAAAGEVRAYPVSIGIGVRTLSHYEWYVSRPWECGTPPGPNPSTDEQLRYTRNVLYPHPSACYVVNGDGAWHNVRSEFFTSFTAGGLWAALPPNPLGVGAVAATASRAGEWAHLDLLDTKGDTIDPDVVLSLPAPPPDYVPQTIAGQPR